MIQAGRGEEGVITAQKTLPAAILIDLILPDIDGLEVTRRIRQIAQLQDTITIATSADVLEASKQEALAAGCDSFIAKPIQIDTLLEVLQNHLGLQWVYEDDGHRQDEWESDTQSPEIIPPPAEALTVLLDLALMGDIAAIREQAEQLDALDEKYKPFTAELRRLVQRFQVNKLGKFIENYLQQR